MTPCALVGLACLVLLGVIVCLTGWVWALRYELEKRSLATRLALQERIGHEVGVQAGRLGKRVGRR